MGLDDFIVLSPILILAATIILAALITAFLQSRWLVLATTVVGQAAALTALFAVAPLVPRPVTPLVLFDSFGLFFAGLVLAAGVVVTLIADAPLREQSREQGALYFNEFFLLLLMAVLGGVLLAVSNHFASFFVGLELLSVSLFVLIAYPTHRQHPLEAGIKYLILVGVSSAFLLFGMALIYTLTGTLSFSEMAEELPAYAGVNRYFLAGATMLFVGIGLKLALVPFHMWAPDVYQGAPTPVAAFLATVSKGAVFAVLVRFFHAGDLLEYTSVMLGLGAVAFASMLAGNLLALLQNNLKRILAYSSIAHLGYLMVAFVSVGALAVEAVGYYLVAYFITMLGAFGVLAKAGSDLDEGADDLGRYRGLFWSRPWLAGSLTLMLLSLAGIPVTVGFVAKFYVIAAGLDSVLWVLVATLIVTSAIGIFYYVRATVVMYLQPTITPSSPQVGRDYLGTLSLVILTVLLVGLGLYPEPLIRAIQDMMTL